VIEEDCHFFLRSLQEDFQYSFTVVDKKGEMLINTQIHERTQCSLQRENGVIMWIHDSVSEKDELEAYLFYFLGESEDKIEKLSHSISKCMFECQRGISYEDNIKEDDMEWMADAYVDDEQNEENKSEISVDEDMYDDIDDEEREYHDHEQQYDNSEMVQAHSYDRTFVARGDGFGIYGTNENGDINYYDDIPIINEYCDKPAQNMILHENENKMLFIDPSEKSKIQCFDFEKAKVVDEWQAQGVKEFQSFYGETKNAQSTPSNNVIACSEKGMYTLDPRVNKSNKSVQQKVYSGNYLFNKISATLDGKIAVASKNGEIRMYTKLGQNAKTMLPGMGESIVGLDLSKDGSWILATTSKYILLVPTKVKSGKNGFDVRMGKEKQKPRKLKLVHSDIIKHNLKDNNFTKATFNSSENKKETFITASIGSYIVVWKLKKVSKGDLGSYSIKKLHNSVVASESRWNTDNELLVTLPKCVTMETRKTRKT